MKLWFGKYEDMEVSEVPDGYLAYLLDYERKAIERETRLVEEVEKEIAFRETQRFATLTVAQQIIEAGYRALAMKLHPDAGGNHDDMVELNATAEKLRRSFEPQKV
jgi:hypothetical protein